MKKIVDKPDDLFYTWSKFQEKGEDRLAGTVVCEKFNMKKGGENT